MSSLFQILLTLAFIAGLVAVYWFLAGRAAYQGGYSEGYEAGCRDSAQRPSQVTTVEPVWLYGVAETGGLRYYGTASGGER